MVAYVRVVKKMARGKGCWKEKKSEWIQRSVRNIVNAIHDEFMKSPWIQATELERAYILLFVVECQS